MSDEIRSTTSKPRKPRPRILVVNNPGPDSDDDKVLGDFGPYPSNAASMSNSSFTDGRQPSPQHKPSLVTDIQDVSRPYPSSRSNPSNPALSSPSSTSSRAFESTPPPSTPGQSNHPEDLCSEGTLRQEPVLVSYPDGSETITPPSATSRTGVFSRLARFHHRPGHSRRSSNTIRPATSPTTSIPESYSSQASRSSPLERITLLVTTDAEHLVTVDVTGASDAAFIRERIFTKLQIDDDEQKRFSIYRTEIGRFAISEALTDEDLMALYRERGDERGSIKLLVSHTHAPVHESPLLAEPSQTSPIHTITPPVLPGHNYPYPPLRPKRKSSKSRRGSTSSVSERPPLDQSAGYEASVSDDLDHVEREPRRPTIRALPQQPSVPRQPLPQPPRGRAPSPGGVVSPDRARMPRDEITALRPDRPRGNLIGTPPSTSPEVSRSQDTFQPPWSTHIRAGSDAALDRDRATQLIDFGPEQSPLRPTREQDDGQRIRRPKEGSRKEPPFSRAKQHQFETPESESRRRVGMEGGWNMVPSNGPSSGYKNERTPTPSDPRPSPSRSHGFINLPPQRPPPPPPGVEGQRIKRPPGKAVPASYVISYKGPQKNDSASAPQSPPAKSLTRMVMKSMNDLNSKYKQQAPPGRLRQGASPLTLKPGGPSHSDQLIANSYNPNEGTSSISSSYHDSPLYGMEIMRMHEGSRYPALSPSTSHHPARPTGTSTQSPPLPSNNTLSAGPVPEPYPRPRSATGNGPTTSPYRSTNRVLQSPNHADFPSPETPQHRPSPSGSSHYQAPTSQYRDDGYYPGTGTGFGNGTGFRNETIGTWTGVGTGLGTGTGFGPRPIPSHSRHDRSNTDNLSTFDYATGRASRTPPRSPVTSKPNSESRDFKAPEQVQRTLSSLPVREDEPSSAESTIRHDEWKNIHNMLGSNSGSSGSNTVVPPRPPLPYMNSNSAASSTLLNRPGSSTTSSTGHSPPHSDDSDSEAGTLWAKPPQKSSNSSRPVLPPIDTDSSPSSHPVSLAPERPPLPGYIPEPPRRIIRSNAINGRNLKDQRTSRFDNNFDVTWAPRPPPEEVLERLDEYFPEHDVDEPVIEAPSGGASPTSMTAEPNPMPAAERRARHKKSIRVVASERRRIDRSSHMEPTSTVGAALRKRNTKLWGSRVEEVPTHEQAHLQKPLSTGSDGSPGPIKPIFRWVRGELIGKGTYGKVYLALNATTGEMIAVKQVEIPRTASDKNDSRQVSVVEALKLESETLKDLDHPNIVQYLGFEETPTFLSIFLEYVPGGSIASCLRKHGKFDEEVTKSFTGQILGGLEYLHSKGILHRDMKADNILVETTGICKISDFGISRRTDDIDMAAAYTSMQGTVFWMAPEVIDSNKKGYNSKIDIWSVGCVVFEMWTGQRPWSGKEAMAVLLQLYQTKQGPPVPKETILSPLADDFRQKCFAMNPDERPTAAELRNHPYLELRPDWSFVGFK